MASKLEPYKDIILTKSKTDREIAKDAKVTMGAVRAYRNRLLKDPANKAAADAAQAEQDGKQTSIPGITAKAPTPAAKAKPKAKTPSKKASKPAAKKPAKKAPAKTSTAPKRAKVVTPEGVDKKCPKCGVEATGEEEVGRIFGFRTPKGGKKIPQSQCRKCRAAATKASKAKKKAEAAKAQAAK